MKIYNLIKLRDGCFAEVTSFGNLKKAAEHCGHPYWKIADQIRRRGYYEQSDIRIELQSELIQTKVKK
jgi:hypothetical protein